jgi:hypothetical protein
VCGGACLNNLETLEMERLPEDGTRRWQHLKVGATRYLYI